MINHTNSEQTKHKDLGSPDNTPGNHWRESWVSRHHNGVTITQDCNHGLSIDLFETCFQASGIQGGVDCTREFIGVFSVVTAAPPPDETKNRSETDAVAVSQASLELTCDGQVVGSMLVMLKVLLFVAIRLTNSRVLRLRRKVANA